MLKKDISGLKQTSRSLGAPLVVTFYIKIFHTEPADTTVF